MLGRPVSDRFTRMVLGGVVVAALAGVSLALAGTPPAQKAGKGCPDGSMCVWAKTGYEGKRLVFSERDLSNRLFRKMNNRASSIKVRKSGVGVLYIDRDGGEPAVCVDGPDGNFRDLGASTFDNVASSSEIRKPGEPKPISCTI